MRPTSPSNRISGYYYGAVTPSTTRSTAGNHPAKPYRQDATLRHAGGRVASLAASLMQLAVSALCVVGALSTWLGFPIGISLTTAVFLGGVMFGAISLLQLYSTLAGDARDVPLTAYDE